MTATTKEQPMTLAEAIAHADEVAAGCGPCFAQHRQLAEWLRRIAAIEAVKLEDLPENIYLGDGRRANAVHDALRSLSSKVAEQAEEIERLTVIVASGIDEVAGAALDDLEEDSGRWFNACNAMATEKATAEAERDAAYLALVALVPEFGLDESAYTEAINKARAHAEKVKS